MEDTIVAISTARGIGAISIIKVSGFEAIEKVNEIFVGDDLTKADSHTIHYGKIVENDKILDEALVTIMRAPRTFTTEDVVEINCHGGIATTNTVLEALLNQKIRLAEAGEFTKRAFLNGRIDLAQAEAVMDLIESKTDKAREQSLSQLTGKMSTLINNFRENIKALIASIEVNIDYPEYKDIEEITIDKVKIEVQKMKQDLEYLIKESKNGEIIKEGIKTTIIGRPNVGKSSLLNKLLEKDKAIVTEIEGTTRDVIEGEINLDGILLNILDTAGIRETDDIIEKIGVEKSLKLIDDANLVILVLNSSEKLTKVDRELLEKIDKDKTIVVLNKNDLKEEIEKEPLKKYNVVSINTNSIDDIKDLKEKIKELFNLEKIESEDNTYLTNARQISLAKLAYNELEEAYKGVKAELPIDIIAINLRESFDLLGEIIGESYDDEVINHLFENFCVGK